MQLRKKTLLNILLFGFVLAFFVTPLGYHSKVLLNKLFSFSPDLIATSEQKTIPNYQWKLKDDTWEFFNFERSKGTVVFINFWASWRLPCAAELQSIQELYDLYGNKVNFYIITNEERPPVELFMEKNEFTFPVTYLIIGEPAPFKIMEPPATYIIDKAGNIVVEQEGIADWNSKFTRDLLDKLLKE
jgi:thiol-disulfide isomerase/thioredoxin